MINNVIVTVMTVWTVVLAVYKLLPHDTRSFIVDWLIYLCAAAGIMIGCAMTDNKLLFIYVLLLVINLSFWCRTINNVVNIIRNVRDML